MLLTADVAFALHTGQMHAIRRCATERTSFEHVPIVMLAKKGGKKGGKAKKGQPKKSGFEWASNFKNKPFETEVLRDLVSAAASGYQAKTGSPLHASLSGSSDVPKSVWNAPVACMVTGPPEEEASEGSVCLYANVAALEAHGLGAQAYDDLIGKSTVLPADMGGDVKFDSDYGKKLKPAAGDVFSIEGTRWLVEKMCVVDGKLGMERLGVAYMWEEWTLDDGHRGAPGGVKRAPELSESELEAAVEAQGSAIRQLKEGDGLTNKDPAVVEAVAELKRCAGKYFPGRDAGAHATIASALCSHSIFVNPFVTGSRGCLRRNRRCSDSAQRSYAPPPYRRAAAACYVGILPA